MLKENLLFEAIKQHDDKALENLLTDGTISLNAQETLNGNTPLMMAVAHRNLKAVKRLVQAGADVNKTDFNGQTALIKAVIWNDPKFVSALITDQTNLNTQDNMGNTASMYAVMAHSYEIQNLLSREAKKRHISLKKEHCRQMQHNGTDKNGAETSNTTHLNGAENTRNESLTRKINAVKELAQRLQADKSALFKKWMDIVDEQHIEAINHLVKNKIVDVDLQDSKGETALFKVSVMGNEKLVRALLSLGANPDIQNNQGITPLMAASSLKNVQIVKWELSYSKNIKLQNHKGKTALDFAMGDKEITALFQEKIKENIMSAPRADTPVLIDNQPLLGGKNYKSHIRSER